MPVNEADAGSSSEEQDVEDEVDAGRGALIF